MTFNDLKTKKARIAFIRDRLATNDLWALKGLLTVFDNQTADEQQQKTVKVDNGIGFTRADADLMCNLAKLAIAKGVREALELKQKVTIDQVFSSKQAYLFRKKIVKYAGQLAKEADAKNPIVK